MRNIRSNMIRNTLILTALIGFAVASGAVYASPLNAKQIDRKANWVLHADMDAFKTTMLFTFLRQKSVEAGIEEKMNLFKSQFSFHPIDDVNSVTIYGMDSNRDRAVVLIHAEFDVNKIVPLLPNSTMVSYGRHSLYSWDNSACHKSMRQYGAVWDEDLIAMAGTLESVQKALDVLDGVSENASMEPQISRYVTEPGQFFYVRADKVAEIAANDPNNMMLKQVEQIIMTAGENSGRFRSHVDMGILTQEKLAEVEQIIKGFIALSLIDAQEKNPELVPVLKAVQVKPNPGLLSLSMDYQSADLIEMLTKAADWNPVKECVTKTASSESSSAVP